MDKSTINGHFNRPGNHDLSNTNAVMVISRAFPKAVPGKNIQVVGPRGHENAISWGPQNSNFTMVHDTQITLVDGVYKPTYNSGGPHCPDES